MGSKILYFVGGVVAGSVATYLVLKRRMEAQIASEVESVKEAYSSRKARTSDSDASEGHSESVHVDKATIARLNEQKKEDILKNSNIINGNGYAKVEPVSYNLFYNPPKAKDIHNGIDEDEELEVEEVEGETLYPRDDLAEKPYVITGDQFLNEQPFFDKITLEYYDDGVLAEALSEEIVDDLDRMIGNESLDRFGEYEEDVVYVRNERFRADYEVIRQHRPFAILDEDED